MRRFGVLIIVGLVAGVPQLAGAADRFTTLVELNRRVDGLSQQIDAQDQAVAVAADRVRQADRAHAAELHRTYQRRFSAADLPLAEDHWERIESTLSFQPAYQAWRLQRDDWMDRLETVTADLIILRKEVRSLGDTLTRLWPPPRPVTTVYKARLARVSRGVDVDLPLIERDIATLSTHSQSLAQEGEAIATSLPAITASFAPDLRHAVENALAVTPGPRAANAFQTALRDGLIAVPEEISPAPAQRAASTQTLDPVGIQTVAANLERQFSPAAATELERFYRYCDLTGDETSETRCPPMVTASPAAPLGEPPGTPGLPAAPDINVFALCARGQDAAPHAGCPAVSGGEAWTRRDLGVYQKCLSVSQSTGVQPTECAEAGIPALAPPENLAVFRSAADPANLVLTGSVKRPPGSPRGPLPQLFEYPWFFRFDIDINADWVPDMSFPVEFRELSLAEGATCLASESRFCMFTGSGILAVDFRDYFTPIRGCGKDGEAYAIYDTIKDHMDLYLELPIECVAPKSGGPIGVWGTQVFEASAEDEAEGTRRLGTQISRLAAPLESPLALAADESAGLVTSAPYLIPLSRTEAFIAQGDWRVPEAGIEIAAPQSPATSEPEDDDDAETGTDLAQAPGEDADGIFDFLPGNWLVAGIEAVGKWQSLPTARLGSANLATAAPGFDLNDDGELSRYGGGLFIGIQPWLEDPGVVPTGWSAYLHLAYEDGGANLDRTVLASAGTAPAIVGLAGNAAVGLGTTTRFDREFDTESWTVGAEIGRTFGIGGGKGLRPFIKLDGSWNDIETRTAITSTNPGVVSNFLREDTDEDTLRLLVGAEATAPLADNLFLRVGGAIGPSYTSVDYKGRDCGDGSLAAGACDGAVFLNRVERDDSFVGFAGEGRLGLVWYVPWNGRYPFAVSLDAAVGTRPGFAVDYPQAAGAGQAVDIRSDQLVEYSVGAKIIIPYGR